MEFSFSDLSVLLIGDNSFNMKLLKNMISQIGVSRVISSHDIVTVYDAVHQNHIDIVILEWELKKEDATYLIDFFKRKEGKDLTKAKIVVITARAKRSTVIEAVKAGADDFLAKPLSVNMLQQRIKHNVEKSRSTKKPGAIKPSPQNQGDSDSGFLML